jgi:hypothetical protein
VLHRFGLLTAFLAWVGCAQGTEPPSGGGTVVGGAGGATLTAGSSEGGTTTSAPMGGEGPRAGAPSTGGEAPSGGAPPMWLEQSCPPNQFATGLDASGVIQCAPVDASAATVINGGCEVFLGNRDGCGGCSDPPTKWGRAGGANCANGVGVDNTCSTTTIGGNSVNLLGLNTDGDVNDDDKQYAGFVCETAPVVAPTPCTGAEIMVGLDGTQPLCAPADAAVLSYMRTSCDLYFGWRDGCNNCGDPPSKWGLTGSDGCMVGGGVGNSCTTPMLGGQAIPLIGIDTDGDVDGDDKFYYGMKCQPSSPTGGTNTGACPDGEWVIGTHEDGTIECSSPAALVASYVQDHCTLYAGWRDGCGGCNTAPAKFGRVREGYCMNDAGADDTCTIATLGGQSVTLFGLNVDGDVNDDDKFYLSFRCD